MRENYTLDEVTTAMECTAKMAGGLMSALFALADRVDRCVDLCEGLYDVVQPVASIAEAALDDQE